MLLLGNGTVLTLGQTNRVIERGAVLVEGSRIKEVGLTDDLRGRFPEANYIDAAGKLIMPGLVNTHMHLYSTFARGIPALGAPPRNFIQILEGLWWKLDKALTPDDIYFSALVQLVECVRNGTTTIVDHHASPNTVTGSLSLLASAARDAGVRACLAYEVSDRDGFDTTLRGIRENKEFLESCQAGQDPMLSGLFGLHASLTLSDKTLEKCYEAAAGTGAGFHIHVAEGIEDLRHSLAVSGKRVVERLSQFNILGEKTIAAHCVHVSEREMKMLRDSGTLVVHNPESNMGNSVGAAPVQTLLREGIRVGLGTDGYTVDMFESAKVANLLMKHSTGNPGAAWDEVPLMLYANNARIAEGMFGGRFGELAPGAWGDIIIVDYHPPTPLDANNWSGHLLFGASGRAVDTTIVNGEIRMLHRVLLGIDEERIFGRARELAAKVWQRI